MLAMMPALAGGDKDGEDDSNRGHLRPSTAASNAASSSAASESPASPSRLLSSFVSGALLSRLRGDSRAFDVLLAQLRSAMLPPPERAATPVSASASACPPSSSSSAAAIERWMVALADCASLLSSSPSAFHPLLSLLLSVEFCMLSRAAVLLYSELLLELAAGGQTEHRALAAVLRKCVSAFETASGTVDADAAVLLLLHRLTRLLPSSLPLVSAAVMDAFPHPRLPSAVWLRFASLTLRLAEGETRLREALVSGLCARVAQLDVQLAAVQQQLQLSTAPSSPSSASTADSGLATLVDSRLLLSDDVVRLDGLLRQLLSFSSSADSEDDSLFPLLLRVFASCMLPTPDLRCLQFLIFFYCSRRHLYAESFMRWLLDAAFDRQQEQQTRQLAVQWLASFIARAAYLRHVSAWLAFRALLRWTTAYAEQFAEQQREGGSESEAEAGASRSALLLAALSPAQAGCHALFYRCFQSLLYVLLFRWRDFDTELETAAEQEEEQRRQLQAALAAGADDDAAPVGAQGEDGALLTRARLRSALLRLVLSPLQPTRYCLPSVLRQYSRVARRLGLLDIRQMTARRRRAERPQQAEARAQALSPHLHPPASSRLSEPPAVFSSADSIFPFDPFFLPESSLLLTPLYCHYRALDDDQQDNRQQRQQRRHSGGSGSSSPAGREKRKAAAAEPQEDRGKVRRWARRSEKLDNEEEDEQGGGKEREEEEGVEQEEQEEQEEEDDEGAVAECALLPPERSPGFGPALPFACSPLLFSSSPELPTAAAPAAAAMSSQPLSPLPPSALRQTAAAAGRARGGLLAQPS
jgi:hypothetical protein